MFLRLYFIYWICVSRLCSSNRIVLSNLKTYQHDYQTVTHLYGKLYAYKNTTVGHVEFEVNKDMHRIDVRLIIKYVLKNNTWQKVYDMQQDCCNVLTGKWNSDRIVSAMLVALRNSDSNFPKKCPFKANKRFYAKRFLPQLPNVPLFAYDKLLLANISIIVNNTYLLSFSTNFMFKQ